MNALKRFWFRPASWLRSKSESTDGQPLRLRRLAARVLLGSAAVTGLAAIPYHVLTAQPEPANETRSYVLQLLGNLHSAQPGVASDAEQRLMRLGVTPEQLQFARLLKHPDRFERFRLVSLLPQIPEPLQTELRIELSRDVDREVRASVVNLLQPEQLTTAVSARLDEMLRHETDSRVRHRVEQLMMSRPGRGQQAPGTLNAPDAQPVRAAQQPATNTPVEVHASVHRPVDAGLQASAVSYVPPGPTTVPAPVAGPSAVVPTPYQNDSLAPAAPIRPASAEFQSQPQPVVSIPLPLPPTGSTRRADRPAIPAVDPFRPLPQTTPQLPVATVLPDPTYSSSVDTPGVVTLPNEFQRRRPTITPPPMPRRDTTVSSERSPLAFPPEPIADSAQPTGILPVGSPLDIPPFEPAGPVPSVQPTLFQNVGVPPAPATAPPPPAEASRAQPRRIVPANPTPLALPERRAVPAPAPAAEVDPLAQRTPGVSITESAVLPLFAGPGPQPQAVINDPLFLQPPQGGPVSSADVGARRLLDRPIDQIIEPTPPAMALMSEELLVPEPDAPFGFTGPSGIIPDEEQTSPHFVPVHDRWRLGYEHQDRYGPLIDGAGWKWGTGYLGVPGHWWDPYNQNVLKGDFPIIGQHTFLNMMLTSQSTFDYRQTPTGTTPFESTRGPNQEEFFGQPESTSLSQNFFFRFDLLHANNAAFKPLDWQFRITPATNINVFHSEELAVINPDVRQGRNRIRDHFVLQEYFAEFKLADISPDYDFASIRAGNQLFNSDFRGFIFFDTNRAVRLFGSRFSNRHQFNLLFYDNVEKETNSGLNTTNDRHQNLVIANYYMQDFIWPGYTFQTSFHWNNDQPSREFDRNDFLVRPDPTGVFQPHRVEAYYFGIAGDGHIGRINVNNAFYWVTGRDGLNPIAGRTIDINAFMGALELSYDRDWARFRASLFYSSGDDNPNDTDGEGFDSILDNPVFAGGEFSYWQRQAIQLFGVRLVNDRSLVPDLRSSGIQGQSNFVNPGLLLFNLGLDMDLTPKLRSITNANYIMFDETEVLSAYTFQGDIDKEVGLDISTGVEWRPFHNDNAIILMGVSALLPDEGFKDLYNEFDGDVETLFAFFADVILTY